jgi:hypothetical protein
VQSGINLATFRKDVFLVYSILLAASFFLVVCLAYSASMKTETISRPEDR